MKTEAFWIDGPWKGRLAIVTRPRGGDWLVDEIRGWRDAGIHVVVSMLTDSEMAELDLSHEPSLAREHGVEVKRLPIPDRGLPSRDEFDGVVVDVLALLRQGRTVAVHCRQGIGRSSVLAASTLVAEGVDPDEAFSTIESARGRPVPDTDDQREWVHDFARFKQPSAHPRATATISLPPR